MSQQERSRKARQKWQRVVSEQARSGQSVKAFCRKRGLCRPYFFVWKKRLQGSAAAKFVEVQVKGGVPSTSGDAGVEIRLQNGRSLMVRPGFDAGHVRALLAVVEAAG